MDCENQRNLRKNKTLREGEVEKIYNTFILINKHLSEKSLRGNNTDIN